MMNMKYRSFNIHYLIFPFLLTLLSMIGCKSPIDLDQDVEEVPLPTKPVELSNMRFSVEGGGRSMRFLPNDTPEESRFSFRYHDIEKIFVDTTHRAKLTVAMKFKISTDIGDSSRFEEILPKSHYCEVDTVTVPIFNNPPSHIQKLPITLKKSQLKTYIFSKRKDGPNGFRMIRTEKVFDFIDDSIRDNHSDTFVFAYRSRLPQGKEVITLVIESGFALNTLEIESYDKKFRSNANGRSILKIQF